MQTSFLEELVAEWYEYKSYIVKRNERVGPLPPGGYEGELDVVAFNPNTNHLLHFETSTDADSWARREKRFEKKFASGDKHIKALFDGLTLPDEIEKKAIFAFGSDKNHKTVGGGKVVPAEDFYCGDYSPFEGNLFSIAGGAREVSDPASSPDDHATPPEGCRGIDGQMTPNHRLHFIGNPLRDFPKSEA